MAQCGVDRIDRLLAGTPLPALVTNDPDPEAVGVVQDLLVCHGFTDLPGLLSMRRGTFGPATTRCVTEFQLRCGMPGNGRVDAQTLEQLVKRPARTPIAARAYITLALGVNYDGITRLVSITSLFEGIGRFGAINRNSDKQGLSYGLIQWAQKPGRLCELLQAFQRFDAARYSAVFGGGDPALAQALITHTMRRHGGVVEANGETADPAFDLVRDPWLGRFRQAALDTGFQRVQIELAGAAFRKSIALLRGYAPDLQSERAIAFMLDLANQHGDAGARSIYQSMKAAHPEAGQADLLKALEDESVRRVRAQYGDGSNEAISTQSRRTAFRTSSLLSNSTLVV